MERAGRKDEEKYLIPTRIGDMDKFDDENMHRYLNFGHDNQTVSFKRAMQRKWSVVKTLRKSSHTQNIRIKCIMN